jgi:hypothetical protein
VHAHAWAHVLQGGEGGALRHAGASASVGAEGAGKDRPFGGESLNTEGRNTGGGGTARSQRRMALSGMRLNGKGVLPTWRNVIYLMVGWGGVTHIVISFVFMFISIRCQKGALGFLYLWLWPGFFFVFNPLCSPLPPPPLLAPVQAGGQRGKGGTTQEGGHEGEESASHVAVHLLGPTHPAPCPHARRAGAVHCAVGRHRRRLHVGPRGLGVDGCTDTQRSNNGMR